MYFWLSIDKNENKGYNIITMEAVALSQLKNVFLLETQQQINKTMLSFYSLINARKPDDLIEGEIKTYDNKIWPHHIDLSLGAPCKLLLAIPKQTDLEQGKSCEVYAEIPTSLKEAELGMWVSLIPKQIQKTIDAEWNKFKEKLPPSVPEHLKSTGFTDL